MKVYLWLFCFLSLNFYGQEGLERNNFRVLKGNLIEENGEPFPGQVVMLKGTQYGTQTDFNGNFCLLIPNDVTVFIDLPFCFEQITREVKSTTQFVELKIGRGKRKSNRAIKRWLEQRNEFTVLIESTFKNVNHLELQTTNCR